MRTLLLLNIVISSTAAIDVMSGWIKNLKNGNCYMFVCDKVNFTVARSQCEKLGAGLTTICDEDENDFIANLARGSFIDGWCKPDDTWIGMVLVDESGESGNNMRWLSKKDCTFRRWNSGQPNNAYNGKKELCVYFPSDNDQEYNKWNDDACSTGGKYVCERKCDVPMIPHED